MSISLPSYRLPITDGSGNSTREWYRFFGLLAQANGIGTQYVNTASATIIDFCSTVIVTGRSSCTLTTPPAGKMNDDQWLWINTDTAMAGTLTITPGSGVIINSAPTSLSAYQSLLYRYREFNSTLYRFL